jgi:hypothetical protein
MNAIDGWTISQKIKELRSKVNFPVLILSGFSDKQAEQFLTYFWLFTAREFLVRLALSIVRKESLTLEMAANAVAFCSRALSMIRCN